MEERILICLEIGKGPLLHPFDEEAIWRTPYDTFWNAGLGCMASNWSNEIKRKAAIYGIDLGNPEIGRKNQVFFDNLFHIFISSKRRKLIKKGGWESMIRRKNAKRGQEQAHFEPNRGYADRFSHSKMDNNLTCKSKYHARGEKETKWQRE